MMSELPAEVSRQLTKEHAKKRLRQVAPSAEIGFSRLVGDGCRFESEWIEWMLKTGWLVNWNSL